MSKRPTTATLDQNPAMRRAWLEALESLVPYLSFTPKQLEARMRKAKRRAAARRRKVTA